MDTRILQRVFRIWVFLQKQLTLRTQLIIPLWDQMLKHFRNLHVIIFCQNYRIAKITWAAGCAFPPRLSVNGQTGEEPTELLAPSLNGQTGVAPAVPDVPVVLVVVGDLGRGHPPFSSAVYLLQSKDVIDSAGLLVPCNYIKVDVPIAIL